MRTIRSFSDLKKSVTLVTLVVGNWSRNISAKYVCARQKLWHARLCGTDKVAEGAPSATCCVATGRAG